MLQQPQDDNTVATYERQVIELKKLMNYHESADYIFGHTNYEMVPRVPHAEANYDLRRVYQLLEHIGNPHLKAKSLHITGTNGKGSTSAMLASVLTAAGYITGLYTSPHLHTMRERIAVNGRMIEEIEVAEIMTRISPKIEDINKEAAYGRLTVFELLTALGFAYFAEKTCEFQVLEVGMGGRFDATNVILPEVCLLTSISYDHTEVLGDTLTEIATEKCGIIKPGCTVISHPQTEEADKVIRSVCREKGTKLIRLGKDVTRRGLSYDFEHQELKVKGRLDDYYISIPLLGQYQLDNAAAAVAALEVLIERGFQVSKEALLEGLARVDFPGRMQIMSREPLVVVDGGHNPGASHSLKEALQRYFKPARSILVIGVSNDKDISGIARELAPVFEGVIATRADNPRSTMPEVLSAEFNKYGIESQIAENVPMALAAAKATAGKEDLICVTGSLFIVGEAIRYLKEFPAG
jgi:dihydrofolate synthase/folylpolyglutamate synthase